jgi:hypothetical protein
MIKKSRLQEAEICMAEIKKDISFIKDALKENTQQHQEIMHKLDTFIDSSPSKFASKETENRVANLEKKNNEDRVYYAKIIGLAIGALFIIQIIIANFDKIFMR